MDLDSLSLEQKVGQLFFIGIPGPELDGPTRDLLDRVTPGGICLFARNIKTREQTRKLLDDLREYLSVAPLLSVDQEGGLVDRLRRIMTPLPAASSINTADDAAKLGDMVGESLSLLGFNMDFAPVVDVVDQVRAKYSNGLFTRPFGRSKEDVVELSSAFLRSLQSHRIMGCPKHFPGLGAATVDSHEELPVVETTQMELEETDLFPYRELLPDVDVVMVGHAAYPKLALQERDQNGKLLPSSLSKAFVTTLLREQLGYHRLVVTDDLEMGAIINTYGIGDACRMAIAAGADMLAICADTERIQEGHRAVVRAVESGEITPDRLDESLERIMTPKAKLSTPPQFDDPRLDQIAVETAELNARLA
ncbi:MAG: glycoside hydrolase family 3 protein [Acidobacteria bacterium]|nr:glycoside hydrolase family 3 protein [Acidobacteriota bacterium]